MRLIKGIQLARQTKSMGTPVCEPVGGFRDSDARSFQILSEAQIDLIQTTQLEVSHGLLLVLDVSSGPNLVSGRHDQFESRPNSELRNATSTARGMLLTRGRRAETFTTGCRTRG